MVQHKLMKAFLALFLIVAFFPVQAYAVSASEENVESTQEESLNELPEVFEGEPEIPPMQPLSDEKQKENQGESESTHLEESSSTEIMPASTESDSGNLVLLVRFAGDTTGDAQTGFNAPFDYSVSGIPTKWSYLMKQFNEVDKSAYVKRSLRKYLQTISEGMYDLVSSFPQTDVATGRVNYITLPEDRDYYTTTNRSNYLFIKDVFAAFNEQYSDYDAAELDKNNDGIIDNVVFLVETDSTPDRSDNFYPHKSSIVDDGLVVGQGAAKRSINIYNVIDTHSFNSMNSYRMGVVAHEYLHSLGAVDLYREKIDGIPVGGWDIMANSHAPLNWPLAITRETLGWTKILTQTQSGEYTLHAPGSGSQQAFAFRSPMSDSEYFIVEYRKKANHGEMDELDQRIGGSGLIVYRVNLAGNNFGSAEGNDYVYIFRPGETALHAAAGSVENAYLAIGGPRESIGSADAAKGITDGAICYSDGRNSGFEIKVISQNENSLTFSFTAPDFTGSDLWRPLTSEDGSNEAFGNGVFAHVVHTDGKNLYSLLRNYTSTFQQTYSVMKHDGANWSSMGSLPGKLDQGKLASSNDALYFSGVDYDSHTVVVFSYRENTWKELVRIPVGGGGDAQSTAIASVGGNIYVLVDQSYRNAQLYKITSVGYEQVGGKLPASFLLYPEIFDLGGNVGVAYGDSGTDQSKVALLEGGIWRLVYSRDGGASNHHSAAMIGEKRYVYVGYGKNLAPRVLGFEKSGALVSDTQLSQIASNTLGGSLVASGSQLYLSVVEGNTDEVAKVKAYVADSSDVSAAGWRQYGLEVYKPTTSVSSVAVNGDICVGVVNKTVGKASVRWHKALEPSPPPDPPASIQHEAVFVAEGKTVARVAFTEGDTTLGSVPDIPAKEGYTGFWDSYELGKSDILIEARYVANQYEITFKNWDGEIVDSRYCDFDSSVEAPSVVRPRDRFYEYQFTGWSPIWNGKCDKPADTVYTAQYKAVFYLEDGVYDIQSALGQSKFIDIAAASANNGANAQLYTQNHTAAQRYRIKRNSDKTYSVINVNSSKALDAQWGGKTNGTNVWQYQANGSAAQKFIFEDAGSGYVRMRCVLNDLYLDIAGAQVSNGANLQLYQGNSTNAQKFKLVVPDDGGVSTNDTYVVSSLVGGSMVLDIAGASKSDGANLQLYKSNGTNAQRFKFERDANGYYTISSIASGKAIDIQWGGTLNGTNVWQYSANGTFAQKWAVVRKTNDLVSIVNARSGMYLDVAGASASNGANVHIWSGNGTNAQSFSLRKT